jgi:hypothetical protein
MPGIASGFAAMMAAKKDKAKGKKAMPAKMKAKMPMKGKAKGGKMPMNESGPMRAFMGEGNY